MPPFHMKIEIPVEPEWYQRPMYFRKYLYSSLMCQLSDRRVLETKQTTNHSVTFCQL